MNVSYHRSGSSGADARKRALSQKLRSLMDEQGLSITDLARRMEGELTGERFNPVNLSHYKAGRSLPRPRYLNALSRVLGVTPQELVPADIALPESEPEVFSVDDHRPPVRDLPSFRLEDVSNGMAWLQINQKLPWPVVLRILELLKGDRRLLGHEDDSSSLPSE